MLALAPVEACFEPPQAREPVQARVQAQEPAAEAYFALPEPELAGK